MGEENRSLDALRCPICDAQAHLVREEREVPVGRRRQVRILDEFYRCDSCGEGFYAPGMADESLRRATAKVRKEDGLLSPEEVRTLRHRLGLTQPEFERLLGVGKNTCARWEAGTVPQSAATDSLLRLIEADAENARRLARWHGVHLPEAA